MTSAPRSIWQILIIAEEREAEVFLNCDECFVILQLLAEEALGGVEERYLLQAVRRHLDSCPKCREHHLQRLRDLEARNQSLELINPLEQK